MICSGRPSGFELASYEYLTLPWISLSKSHNTERLCGMAWPACLLFPPTNFYILTPGVELWFSHILASYHSNNVSTT